MRRSGKAEELEKLNRLAEKIGSMRMNEQSLLSGALCTESINELALAVEKMQQTDGETLKYLSILLVKQPENFPAALRLAVDLDDYERITEGTYEYGQSVLRRIGADDELLDTIEGYIDFEKLGEDSMVKDGVRQTEFGLIRRCSSPFPEQTQGQQSTQ